MATREFNFITGIETSTAPTASDPTDPNDAITLGFADGRYVQGGVAVADTTALKALTVADNQDGDVFLVEGENHLYRYDAGASDAENLPYVAQPDSGAGRYFRISELDASGNLTIPGDLTVNGTTTTVNTTTLDVTDANITVNNGGDQATANTNVAGVTVEMSDATDARVGYDSALASKFKAGEVGSESEVVTVGDAQTFTAEKTFNTASTMQEIATPANPSAGFRKIYATSTGFKQLDSSGVESDLGGGGGSGGGGINYITNSDAEANADGWLTYQDSPGSNPVDGTGGSPSVTFAVSASGPLRGTNSFLFSKDAVNRQGEGVSFDFAIDDIDQNKVLTIGFDVDATDANFSAGDMRAYIYDVDNTAIINPVDLDIANSKYRFETTFISTASTNYRLIFHVATTNATAYAVKFDTVSVGPSTNTIGTVINSWQSYTPTTSGWTGISNVNVEYKRVGDSIQVRGFFTNGTTSASEIQIGLPTGLTIGGTGSTDTVVAGQLLPDASRDDAFILLATRGDSFFNVAFSIQTGASPNPMVPINGNNGFNSSERVSFVSSLIPIDEWGGSDSFETSQTPNKFQRKVLASDFGSGNSIGTDLFTFNNLVVGRVYSLDVNMEMNISSGQANFGITLGSTNYNNTINSEGFAGYNITFVADSTTLQYELKGNSGTWNIKGTQGSTENTWAVLTELNNTTATSDFT